MTAKIIDTAHGFDTGDHVYATLTPRLESVHWIITSLHQAAPGKVYATLRSGMSSRSRVVPIETISLHSKGKKK